MHIGGVLIFEGPPPAYDDFLAHVGQRLHRIPRYRQKLAVPPLDAGRPLWVDDPDFHLEYHVRETALPAPGNEQQLLLLTARIASQRLDRERPLWELWLVEGLKPAKPGEPDRFALICKNHHSLVDGVSNFDLATALFDITPDPQPADPQGVIPWQPGREPSRAELLVAGVRGAVGATLGLARGALAAAAQPGRSTEIVRDALEGVGSILWAVLNPAPETPLNVPIGPHRRYAIVRLSLADFKSIKDEFGGTVNDVVLTVVTGALRDWLRSRGLATEGLELRALVPVSVRVPGDEGSLGNRLTLMRGPLPVYVPDAVTCLRIVSKAMYDLKASKQAVGAATLAAANELAPPAVLAQASRLQFSPRLFNVLVTNIPGPQFPLYVLGRKLTDLFPLPFLASHQGLAVAIISYDGQIEFGLLGDYDALPDLDLIAEGIKATVAELLEAVAQASRDAAPPEVEDGDEEEPETETKDRDGGILPSGPRRGRRGPAADMRAGKRPRRPR